MKIIAHRGASACAPENTMTAFRLAWSEGAHGIELDVQMTRDRELVVFHDATGERLTGDHRVLSALSWHDVQQWDVGVSKRAIFQGTSVPRLVDVLEEAPPKALTMVEIKSGMEIIPELHRLFNSFEHKSTALLAFDLPVALSAAKTIRHVPVYLNVEAEDACDITSIITIIQRGGIHGVSLGWSDLIDETLVGKVHHAGMPIAVWTVNKESEVLRAKALGVDILMTDRPEVMVPLVKHG